LICFIHIAITDVEFNYPLPQRERVFLYPVLGPPDTEYLSPQRQLVLVCPYCDYNRIIIICVTAVLYWCALIETTVISPSIYITIISLSYTGIVFRLWAFGFRVYNVEVSRLMLRVQGLRSQGCHEPKRGCHEPKKAMNLNAKR
jgi:hypothetical protein